MTVHLQTRPHFGVAPCAPHENVSPSRALGLARARIASLESAIATRPPAITPPASPTSPITTCQPTYRAEHDRSATHAPDRVIILPTVYTNLGSLIDVFG